MIRLKLLRFPFSIVRLSPRFSFLVQSFHDSADASQGLYTAWVALGLKQLVCLGFFVFALEQGPLGCSFLV